MNWKSFLFLCKCLCFEKALRCDNNIFTKKLSFYRNIVFQKAVCDEDLLKSHRYLRDLMTLLICSNVDWRALVMSEPDAWPTKDEVHTPRSLFRIWISRLRSLIKQEISFNMIKFLILMKLIYILGTDKKAWTIKLSGQTYRQFIRTIWTAYLIAKSESVLDDGTKSTSPHIDWTESGGWQNILKREKKLLWVCPFMLCL